MTASDPARAARVDAFLACVNGKTVRRLDEAPTGPTYTRSFTVGNKAGARDLAWRNLAEAAVDDEACAADPLGLTAEQTSAGLTVVVYWPGEA